MIYYLYYTLVSYSKYLQEIYLLPVTSFDMQMIITIQ